MFRRNRATAQPSGEISGLRDLVSKTQLRVDVAPVEGSFIRAFDAEMKAGYLEPLREWFNSPITSFMWGDPEYKTGWSSALHWLEDREAQRKADEEARLEWPWPSSERTSDDDA